MEEDPEPNLEEEEMIKGMFTLGECWLCNMFHPAKECPGRATPGFYYGGNDSLHP